MTVPRPRKPLRGDEDALFAALADELVRIVGRLVQTDHSTVDDACQFAWLQLLRCQPHRETIRAWPSRWPATKPSGSTGSAGAATR
jgi:DNA-directed RNA polymerase specialized sigma24 family protein